MKIKPKKSGSAWNLIFNAQNPDLSPGELSPRATERVSHTINFFIVDSCARTIRWSSDSMTVCGVGI